MDEKVYSSYFDLSINTFRDTRGETINDRTRDVKILCKEKGNEDGKEQGAGIREGKTRSWTTQSWTRSLRVGIPEESYTSLTAPKEVDIVFPA